MTMMIVLHKFSNYNSYGSSSISIVIISFLCINIMERMRTSVTATTETIGTYITNANELLIQNVTYAKNMHQTTSSEFILSRKRRYVAFPEGSSFSVAVCATVGVIGNPDPGYMSFGLNWGVAYDLPNSTWVLNSLHGFKRKPLLLDPKPVIHRRIRKDLFIQIESIMNNFGYNGRMCIARSLCEAIKYFEQDDDSTILEVMIKKIFSFPHTHQIYHNEDKDVFYYNSIIRRSIRKSKDCSYYEKYCNFSFIDLLLGKYSLPQE